MIKENTIPLSRAAIYGHQITTTAGLREILRTAYNGTIDSGSRFTSGFYNLEYLNSPLGLIVYAMHEMNGCEAFYPSAIDFKAATGVEPFADAIEAADADGEGAFVRHCMSRKTTGFLIHAAYGRMIHGGDPEAPAYGKDFRILEVFDTPSGLIVAAFRSREVFVIRPDYLSRVKMKEAA